MRRGIVGNKVFVGVERKEIRKKAHGEYDCSNVCAYIKISNNEINYYLRL